MAIFTKYRPKDFDEMVGNAHVIESVKALVEKKDSPKSWLFTGMSGSGKTTIARIIAKKFGATATGIFEVDIGIVRGIDGVRSILEQSHYRQPGSPVSVYIFDECHQLTKDAQNALLKALEDAPRHAYFILCTTDPQKLISTIRTRCEEFKFEPVPEDVISKLLVDIAEKEGIKVGEDIIVEIAMNASGSPRLALNMLERCAVVGDNVEKARKLITGMGMDFQVEGDTVISGELFSALLNSRNHAGAWAKIGTILDEQVFKTYADVPAVKQGLTSRMGRYLLKTPHPGIAESIIVLESIKDMYSNASFVGIMYKVSEAFFTRKGQANDASGTRNDSYR